MLIDFGLGAATDEAEQRAVDLHVAEQALRASDGRETLVAAMLDAYVGAAPKHEATLARLEEIRHRGRYR